MRISDWSSDVCSSDLASSLFRTDGEPSALPKPHRPKGVPAPMEPCRLRRDKGAFLLPLTHDPPCADWMRGGDLEICPSTPHLNHAATWRPLHQPECTCVLPLWRSGPFAYFSDELRGRSA